MGVILDKEVFEQINVVVSAFIENGSNDNPPKFVIVAGGPGAGKTTFRKERFNKGYVNFDPWEIYLALESKFGEIKELSDYSELAANLILSGALEQKRNIVIELVGDQPELQKITGKFIEKGYKVDIEFVQCDPMIAYERHLKAIAEDKNYMPSVKTEKILLSYLSEVFGNS